MKISRISKKIFFNSDNNMKKKDQCVKEFHQMKLWKDLEDLKKQIMSNMNSIKFTKEVKTCSVFKTKNIQSLKKPMLKLKI
jgi:hypothetical protein